MMIDGKWAKSWEPVQAKDRDGRFVRQVSGFRNWITPDGRPGPTGEGGFRAEPGRYRLFVGFICPWASRTLAVRKLKGLEDIISVSVISPQMTDEGWAFEGFPGATGDPLFGSRFIHEIYTKADPHYTGRATVPVLWDTRQSVIVNNESADIVRMFNTAFSDHVPETVDLYPADLAADIDALNARTYDRYNNGVYKCGFATTQAAYDEAFEQLFDEMARLDGLLSDRRPFLFGDRLTESDIRIFVTSMRFDAAYHGLFKCNLQRLKDFGHLHTHMVRVLNTGGVAETVDLDHIKSGYYSLKALNPQGIVPKGPAYMHDLVAAAKAV
jgi:putative glutathione S-transferase